MMYDHYNKRKCDAYFMRVLRWVPRPRPIILDSERLFTYKTVSRLYPCKILEHNPEVYEKQRQWGANTEHISVYKYLLQAQEVPNSGYLDFECTYKGKAGEPSPQDTLRLWMRKSEHKRMSIGITWCTRGNVKNTDKAEDTLEQIQSVLREKYHIMPISPKFKGVGKVVTYFFRLLRRITQAFSNKDKKEILALLTDANTYQQIEFLLSCINLDVMLSTQYRTVALILSNLHHCKHPCTVLRLLREIGGRNKFEGGTTTVLLLNNALKPYLSTILRWAFINTTSDDFFDGMSQALYNQKFGYTELRMCLDLMGGAAPFYTEKNIVFFHRVVRHFNTDMVHLLYHRTESGRLNHFKKVFGDWCQIFTGDFCNRLNFLHSAQKRMALKLILCLRKPAKMPKPVILMILARVDCTHLY